MIVAVGFDFTSILPKESHAEPVATFWLWVSTFWLDNIPGIPNGFQEYYVLLNMNSGALAVISTSGIYNKA